MLIFLITIDNKVIRVDRYGRVAFSAKMSTTIICVMELSTFPLDRQVCSLQLYSFEYYSDELYLFWDKHTHYVRSKGVEKAWKEIYLCLLLGRVDFFSGSSDALASFQLEHNHASFENRSYCHGGDDEDDQELSCRCKNILGLGFEFKRHFFSVFFISYCTEVALRTYIDTVLL